MATNSKHSVSINASSWFSVKSAKSAVGQIPKTRACPWVAQWFTIPQALLKPMQMALGLTAAVLMLLWRSEDGSSSVSIVDLNDDSRNINYRNQLSGFVGICLLTVLYSIGMATLGVSGLNLPPFLQVVFAGVMLAMWVVGAPALSASVTQLDNSYFARSKDLDTLYLQVATGLGFVLLMAFVLDILLGFMMLRRAGESSEQFSQELNLSKSSLMAVRSGKSLASAQSAGKAATGAGPPPKASPPVNDRSPLKENEEAPSDDDNRDVYYSPQ